METNLLHCVYTASSQQKPWQNQGTMLNSNTDNTVLGPPDLNVVPAGNHMGKMLGVVARFAQTKFILFHEQQLLQFEAEATLT